MPAKSLPLAGGHAPGALATARTDPWYTGPLATVLGLSAFIAYSTWAAFQGAHYYAAPYLSPFYSPVLFSQTSAPGAAPLDHTWFGAWPGWWPSFLPASPAFLILMFPGAFRFTCYYYRKAYYRSFVGSPPGCAVSPALTGVPYAGETRLLVFQNLHRFALYFALVFVVLLAYDALLAFSREGQLGVGVGSLVLTVNALLLGSYTVGCHSFRHLVGGGNDCMSCGKATLQYSAWNAASWFNKRHMEFAWLSLFWVGFSDFYVRMVSMGVIHDLNTWGH